MRRSSLDSTSLASVGYDPRIRTLEVEFQGGRVYRYLHVPPRIHSALLQAESAGKFLNQEIKGMYPCIPVEERRRPPRRHTA